MVQPGIGREQLPSLLWTDEMNLSIRKTLLGGIQNHTGNGYVSAQRDPRQNEYVSNSGWVAVELSRPAHAFIARHQMLGMQPGNTARDDLREKLGIDFAQPRLEQV